LKICVTIVGLVIVALLPARPGIAEVEDEKCPFSKKRPPIEALLRLPLKFPPTEEHPSLCEADLSKTNLAQAHLSGADLRGANLSLADLRSADLFGASLVKADLYKADLRLANLSKADLRGADLSKADLRGVNLSRADLTGADLSKADLGGANLSNAHLALTNLSGAQLFTADLSKAVLTDANLDKANLHSVSFECTIFDPLLEGLRDSLGIEFGRNLSRLTFFQSPAALQVLRERFARLGLREQEREVTFAKLRTQRIRAWNNDQSFIRKLEGAFQYVAFELTCGYGLYFGRPLRILGLTIPLLGLLYAFALRTDGRGALWRVWTPDRIRKDEGRADPERLSWSQAKWPGGPPHGLLFCLRRALGIGLLFSLVSAFQIGWRELNVGNWITRLQPREYTLRATGWVRVVSGAQSLLSVYLLALWALSYFGRPFE
jgi:hypothetical protein